MQSELELVERLKPSWAVDEAISRAIRSINVNERNQALSDFLVANNALKREAAAAIAAKDAEIERLVAERDEAREALKPFNKLGEIILAEAPENAKTVVCFKSASGEQFAMQLDYFRRARQALRDNP